MNVMTQEQGRVPWGQKLEELAEGLRVRFTQGKPRPEWLMAATVFCLFWLVSRRYAGPAYLSDEVGYLGNAALLAGYSIDGASSWHAGYSLLLAPLFRVFSEPEQIWQGVIVLNAAMWACSFVLLLHLIARFFPKRGILHRVAAVGVAAMYPTWLTMSGYAFPTSAITLFFLLAVFAALLIDLRRPLTVVPHALAVGFLYWIHPTGLAIVGASIVALTVVSSTRRHVGALLSHLLLVSALLVAYGRILHPWLLEIGTAPSFAATEHYPSYIGTLLQLGRPEAWFNTALAALGQVSYLTVSSLGLFVFGFFVFVRFVRENFAVKAQQEGCCSVIVAYAGLFVLLSLIGMILMGSAGLAGAISSSFEGHPRVDQWIYGRYAEGVLLPFLAFGFLAPVQRRWLPALAGGLVVGGAFLSAWIVIGDNNNLVNITSFWPRYLIEMPNYLLWMAVGALGVFLFQVARQEGTRGKAVALGLLVGVSLLSGVTAAQFHANKLEGNKPTALVEAVRTNFEHGCCIGFNPEMPAEARLYHEQRFQLHLFYLYDYAYRRMLVSDWLSNCDGPLLTYHIDQLQDVPGLVLLGQEVRSGLYLVARDREQGFLIPDEAPNERTFYSADGWSLRQDLYRYGEGLGKLPSQVGVCEDDMIVSTGREGLLVYGPNVVMNAGLYSLVVRGTATSAVSTWVDVVSGVGNYEHAAFAVSTASWNEMGVLASGLFYLAEDVVDLEVRVHVGDKDEVRLSGYELVPVDSAPASFPQRAAE